MHDYSRPPQVGVSTIFHPVDVEVRGEERRGKVSAEHIYLTTTKMILKYIDILLHGNRKREERKKGEKEKGGNSP